MSRSLVAEKSIKLPKELKKFFNDPPLVGDERRRDYENLFAALAMAVEPADAIEWIYFADVVDLTWEIRRMRNIKTGIINSSLEEQWTAPLGTAAFLEESEDEELAEAGTEEDGEEDGEEDESEPEDPAALLAEAYRCELDTMDAIERQTASLELRRNAALRELAWHSDVRARKLDRASREIIDGEFSEAAE